jgi:ParB-like nuclease domain
MPASSGLGEGSTFEKARRKRARKKLAARLKDEDTRELLPLGEVTRRLRQFEQRYVGIRSIPVAGIVGTVDRSRDFDRQFLPRRPEIGDRWRRVERAFPEGDFPPIVVYEVDGSYFLVDGHHRVAIARQRGIEQIDAEITRLRTRYPLPPDADVGQLIHMEQERIFMEESGLERARPEARIELSRPQGYVELLERVRVHGYHLMKDRGRVVPDAEIAGDWYDWLYLPVVRAAREAGLQELFPDAPDGDLFLWFHHQRRALYPERGGITDQEVARLARAERKHRTGQGPLGAMRRIARRDSRPS